MKKIPLRKCVVTNTQHPKTELLRVVRDNAGNVFVDTSANNKMNGRGAYIVKDKDVILKAKKSKALNRHLEVEVPEAIYDELIKLASE